MQAVPLVQWVAPCIVEVVGFIAPESVNRLHTERALSRRRIGRHQPKSTEVGLRNGLLSPA